MYRTADNTNLSYLAYRYDGNDNITAIVDQLGPGGTQVYGYDKLDRLTFTLISSGSASGSTSYAYTAGTNRLASVSDAAGARTIAYDGRGNTASELRPGGITAATAYDGYGRLTGYSRSDISPLSFTYSGLDDRVAMDLPTGTRHFVYDAGGRVIGEYGLSANDVKAEYIWLAPEVGYSSTFGGGDGLGGYMPLAVATPDLSGTIELTWVHGNHLGVPLITTDAAGNPITWTPDYLAPGFPGQTRVLADLYYNRYRDYDPTTGRYIEADPIGLGGGWNDYGYVGGNPLNRKDPSGRCFEDGCIGEAIIVWTIIGALGSLDWQLLHNGGCINGVDWNEVAYSGAISGLTGGLGKIAAPWLGRALGGLGGRIAGGLSGEADGLPMRPLGDLLGDSGGSVPAGGGGGGVGGPGGAGVSSAVNGAAGGLSDDALVVRGGNEANHSAAKINAAIGQSHTPGVIGFSVQCNGGTCLAELAQILKNRQVGVTTVAAIRALGGDVIVTPGIGFHATVTGISGEAASLLFRILANPTVGP